MSENSKIEWTGPTWPIVVGCEEAGPECTNCYAVRGAHRMGGNPNPKLGEVYQGLTTRKGRYQHLKWNGVVRPLPARLDWPITRFKTPSKIFVTSMGDLFHKDVQVSFLVEVFKVMEATPHHTYQVLTKRAENMRLFVNELAPREHDWREWPLPNVHLGVSVGVSRSLWRVEELLKTQAAIRFVSAEPLLAPVSFEPYLFQIFPSDDPRYYLPENRGVDWIIIGGESGPGARAFNPDWARKIIKECGEWGVPVFVKQMGSAWAKANGSRDGKGGLMEEWPEDLRVREFPEVREAVAI